MPFLCQGEVIMSVNGEGAVGKIYISLWDQGVDSHFPEWIRLRLVLPQPCTPDRVDVDDAGGSYRDSSRKHLPSPWHFPFWIILTHSTSQQPQFAHFPRINSRFLLYADDHRYDWTRKGGIRSRKSWVGSLQLMKICDDHPSRFSLPVEYCSGNTIFQFFPLRCFSYFHVTFWWLRLFPMGELTSSPWENGLLSTVLWGGGLRGRGSILCILAQAGFLSSPV